MKPTTSSNHTTDADFESDEDLLGCESSDQQQSQNNNNNDHHLTTTNKTPSHSTIPSTSNRNNVSTISHPRHPFPQREDEGNEEEEFELDFSSDDDSNALTMDPYQTNSNYADSNGVPKSDSKLRPVSLKEMEHNTNLVTNHKIPMTSSLRSIPSLSNRTLLGSAGIHQVSGRGRPGIKSAANQILDAKFQELVKNNISSDHSSISSNTAPQTGQSVHDPTQNPANIARLKTQQQQQQQPQQLQQHQSINNNSNNHTALTTTALATTALATAAQNLSLIKGLLQQARDAKKTTNAKNGSLAASVATLSPSSSSSSTNPLDAQLLKLQLSSALAQTTNLQSKPTKKLSSKEKAEQAQQRRLEERRMGLIEWRVFVNHIRAEYKLVHDLVLTHHIIPHVLNGDGIGVEMDEEKKKGGGDDDLQQQQGRKRPHHQIIIDGDSSEDSDIEDDVMGNNNVACGNGGKNQNGGNNNNNSRNDQQQANNTNDTTEVENEVDLKQYKNKRQRGNKQTFLSGGYDGDDVLL